MFLSTGNLKKLEEQARQGRLPPHPLSKLCSLLFSPHHLLITFHACQTADLKSWKEHSPCKRKHTLGPRGVSPLRPLSRAGGGGGGVQEAVGGGGCGGEDRQTSSEKGKFLGDRNVKKQGQSEVRSEHNTGRQKKQLCPEGHPGGVQGA